MGVIRSQRMVREVLPQDYSAYRPDTRSNKSHIDDPLILNKPHSDDPSLTKGGTMVDAIVGIAIGGFVALLILLIFSYLLYKECRNMLSNLTTKFNLKKFGIGIRIPKGVENSIFDDFPENIPPLPVQRPPIYSKPIPLRYYTNPPKFQDELPKTCPDFYTSKTLVLGDQRGRQVDRKQYTRDPLTSGLNYEEERLSTPPIENNSPANSTSRHSKRPSDAVLGRSFSQIPAEEVEQEKRFTNTYYHLMDPVDVEDED